MPRWRRVRGLLLRLVLHRPAAVALGCALAAPGLVLAAREFPWENGISDGLSLISIATGAAIAYAGLSGRRPDWNDSEHEQRLDD